jgi:hypothetical protein
MYIGILLAHPILHISRIRVNIVCQPLILWHAMFAVNLGPADKKACIMVGLYGVLHVVEMLRWIG